MAYFSIFQFLSIVTLSLFIIGLLNIFLSDKENGCEMTYMYEYPQFVRINVAENELYPQYGLYAYSEGRFTEKARKMKFDGIPVLFLPGNVGSHKQVRSLASVALRKAIPHSKYGFHFDYFTVDFNEELSGLFGGVLEKQAIFSSHCLKSIMQLYSANKAYNSKPQSIIVIGHSMGGIIARYLLTMPQNKNTINLIITLASPHEFPIIAFDPYLNNFYHRINDFWKLKTLHNPNLAPITEYWDNKVFITIGGGEKDLLVPSALTTSSQSDIKVQTTSIPSVWVPTDHLCIVWCKQLVLVLNRFLFSIIDQTTKQLTTNSSNIIHMGKHFLMIGHDKNNSAYDSSVEFLPNANWYEDNRRQYSFKHDKIDKTWYYMVRLIDLPDYEAVTLEAIDLEDKDWLFGCQAKYVHGQHRICMNGRHLSQFSRWTASKRGKRRVATLDLRMLKASYPHWTHILLRISPTNRPVEIHVDIHSKGSRRIEATLPAVYNLARRTIVKETPANALQYNITIFNLDMLYQAYLLYVEPLGSCSDKQTFASAEVTIPWARGFNHYDFFTETEKAPMKIKLLKGNPNLSKNNTQHVSVNLLLDPECKYSISIAVSLYDVLGQLSRHYVTSLPAYFAAVLLLVLRHWAKTMHSKDGQSISFHAALCGENLKPYYLIISSRLGLTIIMSVPLLSHFTSTLKIGLTSSQNFTLLPLFLYVVSVGLAHVLGAVCWGFLIFSGQVAHKIVLRLVSFGRRGGGNRFWEWVTKEIRNAPGFGSFLLIALGCGSCGAAALVAGAAFYFFLLTKMYEDYLEDFVYKTIAKVAKKFRKAKKNKNEAENEVSEKEKSSEIVLQNESTKDLDGVPKSDDSEQANSDAKDKPSISASSEGTTDVLSENPKKDEIDKKSDALVLDSLHFHFAMFFIWALVTLLNVPTLLTWAHNFKYNKVLTADPSFYPSMIMSASAFSLWQIDVPRRNVKFYDILEKLIYFTAVVSIMIAPISLYRLNYILSGVFLLITLHQTFSVEENSESSSPNEVSESSSPNSHPENEPSTSGDADQVPREEDEDPMEKFRQMKEKFDSE